MQTTTNLVLDKLHLRMTTVEAAIDKEIRDGLSVSQTSAAIQCVRARVCLGVCLELGWCGLAWGGGADVYRWCTVFHSAWVLDRVLVHVLARVLARAPGCVRLAHSHRHQPKATNADPKHCH